MMKQSNNVPTGFRTRKPRRRQNGAASNGGILASLQPNRALPRRPVAKSTGGKSFSDAGGESTPSPRRKSRDASRCILKSPPPSSVVVSTQMAPLSVSPMNDQAHNESREDSATFDDSKSDVSSLSSLHSYNRARNKGNGSHSKDVDSEDDGDGSLKPTPLFQDDEESCSYTADDEELSEKEESDEISESVSSSDVSSSSSSESEFKPVIPKGGEEIVDDEYAPEDEEISSDEELEVDVISGDEGRGGSRRGYRYNDDDSTETEEESQGGEDTVSSKDFSHKAESLRSPRSENEESGPISFEDDGTVTDNDDDSVVEVTEILADVHLDNEEIVDAPPVESVHQKSTEVESTQKDSNKEDQRETEREVETRKMSSKPNSGPLKREGSVPRGKWSLGSKIGIGSFGVVHVGMNQHDGTLMAVKSVKLEKAVMKDIRREIELLRSLNHVNIVRYLGAEMNDTHLHIFQEWVPGGSVTSLLRKFGPFTLPVLQSYLHQILSGLNYLHDKMILHRDIKGGNVLVNDAGIVKLADFGSSKRLAAKQRIDMESLTMRGTPYFMAPEVFEEMYGHKADIWSVGCVACQMATAIPPWKSLGLTNPMALFSHIRRTEGPPELELPSSLKEKNHLKSFLEKCFFRDPSLRPNARDLLQSPLFLEAVSSGDEQTTSRGLFSPLPGESVSSLRDHMLSPPLLSASKPPRTPHDGSGQKIRQTADVKSSPLLPSTVHYGPAEAMSPLEPNLDTSDWPSWAKAKVKPQDKGGESSCDNHAAMLHSLALSDDTGNNRSNPFSSSAMNRLDKNVSMGSSSSLLVGLDFVDELNAAAGNNKS